MFFGEGISKLGEIIDCAVEFGIIKKSGSWFSYDDMKIGQGKDKVKDFLKDNADICAEVEKRVREEFERMAAEEPSEGENAEGANGEKNEKSKPAKKTKTTKKSSKKAAEPEEETEESPEEEPVDDDDFAEFSTEDFE